MQISRPITETQGLLFNRQNHYRGGLNPGRVRNIVGGMFEKLTALVFDGQLHKCSGPLGSYAPDVCLKNGQYLEVKGVGKTRKAFIYEGRIKKDDLFVENHSLSYCFWHHKASTLEVQTADELIAEVLGSLQYMIIAPWKVVRVIALQSPEMKLNSGYGGTDRQVYGSGRRFSLQKLGSFKCLTVTTEMGSLLKRIYLDYCELASIALILKQGISMDRVVTC